MNWVAQTRFVRDAVESGIKFDWEYKETALEDGARGE